MCVCMCVYIYSSNKERIKYFGRGMELHSWKLAVHFLWNHSGFVVLTCFKRKSNKTKEIKKKKKSQLLQVDTLLFFCSVSDY